MHMATNLTGNARIIAAHAARQTYLGQAGDTSTDDERWLAVVDHVTEHLQRAQEDGVAAYHAAEALKAATGATEVVVQIIRRDHTGFEFSNQTGKA